MGSYHRQQTTNSREHWLVWHLPEENESYPEETEDGLWSPGGGGGGWQVTGLVPVTFTAGSSSTQHPGAGPLPPATMDSPGPDSF